MKKLYTAFFALLILQICVSQVCFSQQGAIFYRDLMYPNSYNPAAIGQSSKSDIMVVHRQQWMGFEESPSSQLLGGDYRLGSTPLAIGVLLKNDKAGFVKRLDGALQLGYHIDLGTGTTISRFSVGGYFGIINTSIDRNAINTPEDPVFGTTDENKLYFDAGPGLSYLLDNGSFKIHLNVALRELPVGFQTPTGNYTINLSDHFYFGASATIKAGEDVSIQPNFVFMNNSLLEGNGKGVLSAGIQATFKERIAIGLAARPGSNTLMGSLSVLLGDEFNKYNIYLAAENRSTLGLGYEAGLGYTDPLDEKIKDPKPPKPKKPKNEKDNVVINPAPDPDPVPTPPVVTNRYWEDKESLEKNLLVESDFLDEAIPKKEAGELKLTIKLADDGTGYDLTSEQRQKELIEKVGKMIRDVSGTSPGRDVQRISLVCKLVESSSELSQSSGNFGLASTYNGELGKDVSIKYYLDSNLRSATISKGMKLTLEQLTALKAWAVQQSVLSNIPPESQQKLNTPVFILTDQKAYAQRDLELKIDFGPER